MMQIIIGINEECGSTAYKPVMKATTIATIANMVSKKPAIMCWSINTFFTCIDMKR